MSPKQKQRPLPSLLYKSFFYTIKDYTPSFQENFRPRDIPVNSMLVLKPIRHCHHSMDYTVCKGSLHFRFPHFVSLSVKYGRALVFRKQDAGWFGSNFKSIYLVKVPWRAAGFTVGECYEYCEYKTGRKTFNGSKKAPFCKWSFL